MPRGLLQTYRQQLVNLDDTRKRMEALFAANTIELRDIHAVYEALFIQAVTGFEQFCESLFFHVLSGKTRYSLDKVERKIKRVGEPMLREIVLQGDDYLDWLPFAKTESRVNLYLIRHGDATDRGRPFMECGDAERSHLKVVYTIRNAIAHVSPHAIRTFQEKVIGMVPLLPDERTPAGFLRSELNPGRRRFENYLAQLATIAAKTHGKPRT